MNSTCELGGDAARAFKPYPDYKDSGVPWLGEVPKHWKTERAKWLFRKMEQPVRENDEVVTCFRDGSSHCGKTDGFAVSPSHFRKSAIREFAGATL